MSDVNEKIRNAHYFLLDIGRNLNEILDDCSMDELLALNSESYLVYSAIFMEMKRRIAKDAFEDIARTQYREGFVKNLMEKRFGLLEGD